MGPSGYVGFGTSIDPGTLSSIDAVRARLTPCEGDPGFSSKSSDGSRLSFMGVGMAAGTGTIGGMDMMGDTGTIGGASADEMRRASSLS
jgi:hypothetical protein